ncbi:hypothetical protein ABT297_30135 [Dactylosporangium sp. NPDC000555]|uniref:hypothetical protein n=1 Tax=Dactylosporangium sp. NPDC000555 TaxID=3154260 RepID=UPI0033211329
MTSPTPGPEEANSVLANLQPVAYDPDDLAQVDATRDLLLQVLALHSARRHELERAQPVDQAAIEAVVEQQQAAAKLLGMLDPADVDQVAQVRAQCISILRAAGRHG